MSYILDALRKAEAERARGAVPGVHAQQGPEDRTEGGSSQAVKLLAGAVVVLLVALLGLLGWQWMDRRPEIATASPTGVPESRVPAREDRVAQAPSSEPATTLSPSPSPSTTTAPAALPRPAAGPSVDAAVPARGVRDATGQAPALSEPPARALPQSRGQEQSQGAPTPSTRNAAPASPSVALQEPLTRNVAPEGLEQPRALPVRPAASHNAQQHTAAAGAGASTNGETPANVRGGRDAGLPNNNTAQAQVQGGNQRGSAATTLPAFGGQQPGQLAGQPYPQPQQTSALPQLSQQQPQQPQQAQAPQQRLYAMNELPDNVRSTLPSYAVSGSSYSENAAARLLIVNGQVAREGDTLPGGAVLEQIKLKSAVLRFKGYRFEMTY